MNVASSALTGKHVVVTRAAGQADELDDLLRRRGAEPLPYPCIAIAPPEDTGPLDAAVRDLAAGRFDWLVLTSRNTVTVLAERLKALTAEDENLSPDPLSPQERGHRLPFPAQAACVLHSGRGGLGDRWPVALAAVGAATARAAESELGLTAALAPDEFVAEALAAALIARLRPGDRALLCQADIARPVLADALQAAGIELTSVIAYRTVIGRGGVDLPALLAARQVDALTFTSASTVRNLLRRLAAEGGRPADLAGVCIVCLGPIVADAACKLGLTVHVLPAEHTIPALVEALEAYLGK
jgi:uroporphyrinogen-III synthase